jgi:NhaA family Na+:H+ antiporter
MKPEMPRRRRSKLAPLLWPINAFVRAESGGGIVLCIAAVTAFILANSRWGNAYARFWETEVRFGAGGSQFGMSVAHWVNDGLMILFFLLAGLEVKRELLIGELASMKRAALPVAAAVGGMVVPVAIYLVINPRMPGAAGWGIPIATDIAFAVGVLALVGRSVPTSVKVFLLAIAIVDDIGAVLVIAIFYTRSISMGALGIAAAITAALILLNMLQVHRPLPYVLLGFGLCVATLFSGVHPTVAGVVLAFTIPASREIEDADYLVYLRKMTAIFERDAGAVPDKITPEQSHALKAIEEASEAVQTPLARLEDALLVPVNFLIVPLFALANAGIDVRAGVGPAVHNHGCRSRRVWHRCRTARRSGNWWESE